MQIQTFIGKVSIEGLHQMDSHINDWLQRNKVTPIHIQQCFGADIHHDGRHQEPIVITSIWYEASEVD